MMPNTTSLPSGSSDRIQEDGSPGQTRGALSEPTFAAALEPVEAQHQDVDTWSGTLIWHREESDARLQVLVIDTDRGLNTATVPTSLRVEIYESGTQTRDIQAYIRKKKAPTVRITYAYETDAYEFEDLVKLLREIRGFAIARCEAQGKDSPLSSLLLAPLEENLMCAILPTSNPQDLPKAQPEPPLEEWERDSDACVGFDQAYSNRDGIDASKR